MSNIVTRALECLKSGLHKYVPSACWGGLVIYRSFKAYRIQDLRLVGGLVIYRSFKAYRIQDLRLVPVDGNKPANVYFRPQCS